MRKERKAKSVEEALNRMVGELILKGASAKAETLAAAHRAMSVEELARLHDILNGG